MRETGSLIDECLERQDQVGHHFSKVVLFLGYALMKNGFDESARAGRLVWHPCKLRVPFSSVALTVAMAYYILVGKLRLKYIVCSWNVLFVTKFDLI